jgi:hypothetical protein
MFARAGRRYGPPLACALLVGLLAGCGSSGSGTTTAAPAQQAPANVQTGEAGEHPASAAERELKAAEAREKLESEQERARGEQVSKEAERLTGTTQAPSERPETAAEQRERELGLGL